MQHTVKAMKSLAVHRPVNSAELLSQSCMLTSQKPRELGSTHI